MATKFKEEMNYEIFCGSKETMEQIKEKGARALNPKTKRFQVIDKNAKYEIKSDGVLYKLCSNLDLRKIAEEKGLII